MRLRLPPAFATAPRRDWRRCVSGSRPAPTSTLPRRWPGCAELGAEFGQQDAPVTAVPHSEADLNAAAAAFVGMKLAEIERVVIEATIQAHGDSLPRAARVLGISPSTLYRKRARWADLSGAG